MKTFREKCAEWLAEDGLPMTLSENKIRKLETQIRQKLLKAVILGTITLLFVMGMLQYRTAPVTWGRVIVQFMAYVLMGYMVLVAMAFVSKDKTTGSGACYYGTKSGHAKLIVWLLLTAIMLEVGTEIDNWWLTGGAILVSTIAQIKRSRYDKLADAITLWEPDNKDSVYYNFEAAKQAAKQAAKLL